MDKNMENEMETRVIMGYMRLYRGYMASMMGSIRSYWGYMGTIIRLYWGYMGIIMGYVGARAEAR